MADADCRLFIAKAVRNRAFAAKSNVLLHQLIETNSGTRD